MNIAVKKALEVLKTYGLSSFYMDFRQLSTIAENENIHLYKYPFRGRLKERYICTFDNIALIYIHDSLEPIEQKHYLAHALGHHFLHKGNYAFISDIVLDKYECQAEDFAAVLLISPDMLIKNRPTNSSLLACDFEVPIRLAERRLRIFDNYNI